MNKHFIFNKPRAGTIRKFKDEKEVWHVVYSCDACLCEGEHHDVIFNSEKEADAFYAEAISNQYGGWTCVNYIGS